MVCTRAVCFSHSVTACGWPRGSWQLTSLAEKGRGSGVEPSLWLKAKLGPWYAATALISSVRVAPSQDVSQARSWVTNIN